MYDERELTVEQIGKVLGVSRTSIYRALNPSAVPTAAGRSTSTGTAEPPAAPGTAEVAVATPPSPTPNAGGGASPAARARGRSRWFVVYADPTDPEHGPVAILSGHISQKAATTALGRARSRAASGAGDGPVLQIRAAEQVSSRLVWDSQAGRGVVQSGPPP